MGSKEDWEELEKWQYEQELKKQQNEKIYEQKFNKENLKGARIFSKVFNSTIKSIYTIVAIIITIIIIGALLFIYSQFKSSVSQDIRKYLKDIYQGENFDIITNYSDKNGKGLYVLCPKSNKNIQFKAYRSFSIKEDYSAQRLKYYIENCEDKTLLEGFNIEEKKEQYENEEFLTYNVSIKTNNYNELSEKVQKVYALSKYLNSKDKRMYESISIVKDDINYNFSIQCYTTRSFEQELDEAKYEYINILKENNNQEELDKISQEEIEKKWKPMYLDLVINEKQMKLYNEGIARVYYSKDEKKYYMSGTNVVLQQIEPIKIIKQGKYTKNVKKIKYRNKIYKVKQSSNNGKYRDNVIYEGESLEDFIKRFDSKVDYDYENKKVYVTIE